MPIQPNETIHAELDRKAIQAELDRALEAVNVIFAPAREAHGGKVPEMLIHDPYMVGHVRGMMNAYLHDVETVEAGLEAGLSMIFLMAEAFGCDVGHVSAILGRLHTAEQRDPDYLKGIQDGTNRVTGQDEGAHDEAVYRFMNRLERFY